MIKSKPLLCLDFDGVIHGYQSGWLGADVIPDPPVPGAMEFIWEASDYFRIAIFSSRTNEPGGLAAMQAYVAKHFNEYWAEGRAPGEVVDPTPTLEIEWPTVKPPAFLTLDDRAWTFTGRWPTIWAMQNFKPWNK